MPAALSPDNTTRYYLTYHVQEADHTMMVRTSADVSDGTASENIAAFIEAMDPVLKASNFVKLERSEEGSSVRVPATWSGPSTWGSGEGDPDDQALFFSYTGKDVAGHKSRVDIFGRERASGEPWRIAATGESYIDDALAALRTTDAVFNTIGGDGAIWNNYENLSVSQHWVKKRRTG